MRFPFLSDEVILNQPEHKVNITNWEYG